MDSSLDRNYAAELTKQCAAGATSNATVNNDPSTPLLFDNQYYKHLLIHKGLFQSDSVLASDERTIATVQGFADNQNLFFQSWGLSFLRLTSIGVKTGDDGEIRVACGAINA